MGIIGCPENPVSTNTSYPVIPTNDTKIGFSSDFPQELRVYTTDSLAWKPFVPSFLSMALGNADNRSRYRLLQNSYSPSSAWVDITWAVQFGTTSTFYGSPWEVSLPPGMTPYDYSTAMAGGIPVIGQWSAYDIATDKYAEGPMYLGSPPTSFPARFAFGDDAGSITGNIQQGTPFTFGSSDKLVGRAKIRVTLP